MSAWLGPQGKVENLCWRVRFGTLYRIREFARLAGITNKALRHYERLGLLQPGRSGAGYRLYTERHLERLEQILALKFLGLPVKEIRAAVERTPHELAEALRMQGRTLLSGGATGK